MEKKKISQMLIGYCCVLSILSSCAKIEEIDNINVVDITIGNNTKIGDDNYSNGILIQTSIPILDSRTGAPAGYVLETITDGAISQTVNLIVELDEEYSLEEMYDENNKFSGYLMNVKEIAKVGDDNVLENELTQTYVPIFDSRTGAPAGYVRETMKNGAISKIVNLTVELDEEYSLEEMYDENNQFTGYLMNVKQEEKNMESFIPILDSRTGAPAGYVRETMQNGAISKIVNLTVELDEEYSLEEMYDENNQFTGYLMNVSKGYSKTK